MTWKEYKTYFRLKETKDDYFFESNKWQILRFAGGGQGKKKFIIESLTQMYWEKDGIDIFNKFLAGIDNIKNTSWYWANTWVFVLYEKQDVFKNTGQ